MPGPQAPADGPQSPTAPVPVQGNGLPMFIASCSNCTRMSDAGCALGRVLAPGKLLCGDYEITPKFRDDLVGVLMKDILTQVRETGERVQKLRAAQRLWN